jgi:uncharacterized protein (TIGR03437 family)
MRWNGFLISIALAAAASSAAPLLAANFGTVVPIGGHAADIALDESRGLLYIANFTAGRIDVMSTSDNTIHTSMNVGATPGGIAISPDARYLVVTNYGNGTTVSPQIANLVTLINLTNNTRQTFSTGDSPLAVAFVSGTNGGNGSSGLALIATTTGFYLFDPLTGALQYLNSFANLATQLPTQQGTFPSQILQTAMTTAADGVHIWGIADAGTGTQLIYLFDATTGRMTAQVWQTTPPLLPRVSVAADGSYALIGWAVFTRAQCGPGFMIRSRYPGAVASSNVTGHAIDSKSGTIYAQIFDATQPLGPPYTSATPAGQASSVIVPSLSIMDADNLTVRDKIYLPENLTGRGLLNSAGTIMYAVSDSGVSILPIGSLSKFKRLAASTEDLFIQSNFCNRTAVTQTFTLADPGGNRTEFSISTTQAGVTVSPVSGITPATITVSVDPAAIKGSLGTLAVPLQISSPTAVNLPFSVRLLVNNPDQDQRGTVVNSPGLLTDILPDVARNQFYVVRQDKNRVLVFDGSNNLQKAVLRTGTTPNKFSFSSDGRKLVVANADSQLMSVYDLDSLQSELPVMLPAGHYGRSVAQSNSANFAVVENDVTPPGNLDRFDLAARCATTPVSLGIWANSMSPTSVVTPTPSQSSILLAEPDGNIKLYSAQNDSWVLSRHDFTSLSGAYAASDPPGPPTASLPDNPTDVGTYIVGNNILNPSLVPLGTLDTTVGNTMGFSFTGLTQAAIRLSASAAANPGVISTMAAVPAAPSVNIRPVRMAESPILSTTTNPFTRTVAPLPSAGTVVTLTTSGVTVLASGYDQAVAPPQITQVASAADGSTKIAPGGLISIYGSNLAPTNVATAQIPLPTALGQSCLVVNGALAPLIFVSSSQVNAQMPSLVSGNAVLTIHTPGGVSDNYNLAVSGNAPTVFTSGTAGPETGLATIVRADNNQLVTPTNPIHPNDVVVIYLTGMGATAPSVADGMPAPSAPLANTIVNPSVTLGGMDLGVFYAGLVPGEVGVYQINAVVPGGVPQGMSVPLVISQSGSSTTLNLRVVK